MAKLINFSDTLKRIAKNQYKQHSFIQEWQTVIILLIILKAAAMAFSIFAGYEYLTNFFFELLNSSYLSITFAIITLLLIEFLTMYFLSKFFKFALRLKFKPALLPLLGATIFFFLSFHLSTNGLAIRQSEQVDNTQLLTSDYHTKKLHINSLYSEKIGVVNRLITTVKQNPQGWKGGKRTILLKDQLRQIDKYYLDIKTLQKEQKQEIKLLTDEYKNNIYLNNLQTTATADKYFNIVAFIVFIILLINGLLMYFHGRVWNEAEKEQAAKEIITDFSADIELKATDLIQTRMKDVFSMFFSALQNQFDDNSPQIAHNQKKPVFIGFKGRTIKNAPIPPKVNEKDSHGRNTGVKHEGTSKQFEHGSAICPNCSKTFQKNSYNHKFCVELCRIEFWEKKNKKDYSRYKKLHK